MRKNNIWIASSFILAMTILLSVSSCTKNFEEMNQNPFLPTGTTTEALFNGVVKAMQQNMN